MAAADRWVPVAGVGSVGKKVPGGLKDRIERLQAKKARLARLKQTEKHIGVRCGVSKGVEDGRRTFALLAGQL
jgi:hypothetical protein